MSVKLFTQSSVANSKFTGLPASGASTLKDADISATTGSPTTATYTSGSLNYKTYSFTGSGSITFSKSGLVDVMIIGGGGGGADAYGGGGAGSLVRQDNVFMTATTHTITVGAGGPQWTVGSPSYIDVSSNAYAIGAVGGYFGVEPVRGNRGGAAALGMDFTNMGKDGGAGNTNSGGGGGGNSTAGSNSTANYGAAGGAGTSNTFRTGSSQSYCGGGGGGGYLGGGASGGSGAGAGGTNGGGAGTANTGSGGGGTWVGGGGTGGSGLVVIRVLQ